ncbi:MAG TPA: MoaD/ThiS family protein [Polyangiaceae bacterium]|nr:MoaD/ThiS family protein [Polyangiaceae bacterium]
MAVTVRIPTPLRTFTGGNEAVKLEGKNVRELVDNLEAAHPGIKERLIDEKGAVRRFVNLYLGEEDIRFLDGLDTELSGNEELSIVPAIAGGR